MFFAGRGIWCFWYFRFRCRVFDFLSVELWFLVCCDYLFSFCVVFDIFTSLLWCPIWSLTCVGVFG